MKVRGLVLALCLAVCAPVWAARWVEVAEGVGKGSVFYVDADSLYQGTGGIIGYWLKTVYKNNSNAPGEAMVSQGQKVWYGLSLNGESCGNDLRYAYYQWTFYGMRSQVLDYGSSSPVVSRPVPDSVGEALHNFVCGFWRAKQEAKGRVAGPYLEQLRQEVQ